MKKFLVPLVFAMLLVGGCVQNAQENGSMPPAPKDGGEVMEKNDDDVMKAPGDAMEMEKKGDNGESMEDEGEMMADRVFQNKIVMTNVSDLEDVKGEGFYGVIDGETRVIATFMIEDPKENFFYEGWLVCGGKAYTTGALEKFDGLYENYFSSKELPEVCEKYVLTIEEDDGNPAPAEHVMDGVMEGIGHAEPQMDWDDERFEAQD